MLVIPAIDLYEQKVVRMVNGVKGKRIVYEFDLIDLVSELIKDGFPLVHIVDLSMAIDGSSVNRKLLMKLSEYSCQIQLGGGIRNLHYSKELLEMGFKRQIFSSMLIEKPEIIADLINIGITPIFSLDTKNGVMQYNGWMREDSRNVLSFLSELKSYGLTELIHTCVEYDGTMQERDFSLTKELAVESGLKTYAAGGVSSEKVLESAKTLCKETNGLFAGVIVGRAFLEGFLNKEVMRKYVS
ncbi:HisA/HisF-related TIM barrel protein [Fervidobacterium sp.]